MRQERGEGMLTGTTGSGPARWPACCRWIRGAMLSVILAAFQPGLCHAGDDPLALYGDDHQTPFVSRDGQPGLFREATEEMLRRAGLPYTLTLTPWRRAQAEVLGGGGGLIMNLARTPARETEYRWMVRVLPTAYVLAGLAKDYQSLTEAFADGPVVVLAGTPRADEALKSGGPDRVVQVNDPQQAVRLLRGGRVSAWYEIDLRILHAWRSAGFAPESLRIGAPQQVTGSYLAANPGLPDADRVEARLRMAFASMQADGSWQRILAAYIGPERAQGVAAAAWAE